jgi:hypothetical protein
VRTAPALTVIAAAAAVLLAGCSQGTSGTGTSTEPGTGTSAAAPKKPAGNGVADLPAADIVTRAGQALRQADTVRVSADLVSGTDKIKLDLRISGTKGAVGTVSVSAAPFTVLRIGPTAYLKGDAATWTKAGAAEAAQTLAGKWIKVPTNDKDFAEFVKFTQVSTLADLFVTEGGTADKTATSLRGQAAVKLSDSDGSALYVATSGKPYPLRVQQAATATDHGTVDFTDFNRPVTLTPPPADQVIDLSTLGGSN